MNFCSACGSARLEFRVPDGDHLARFVCADCATIHYRNPKIVVGCLPEWEGAVLLCRRAIEPRHGLWTLPAGFLENGETLSAGAMRETLEEAEARVDLLDLYTVINLPQIGQDLEVMVCWFHEKKLQPGGRYVVRHTTREMKAIVKEVRYKMNINTLHKLEGDLEIGMNDVGRLRLRTTAPLFFDSYKRNRNTGSLILIDEFTNNTVAAGMILDAGGGVGAAGESYVDMGGL